MPKFKLYHYAVFLRTNAGTLRRNVALTKRDISEAGRKAQREVTRHLRGQPCTILDVVPLRERASTKPARVIKRGKRPVTERRVSFILARKPKARPSCVLSRKGVAPLVIEKQASYVVERASDKLWEMEPKARTCESPACIKRRSCSHGLPLAKSFLVYSTGEQRTKPRSSVFREVLIFTWVTERAITNRAQAAARANALLAQRGIRNHRITACYTLGQAQRWGYAKRPRSYFSGSEGAVIEVVR